LKKVLTIVFTMLLLYGLKAYSQPLAGNDAGHDECLVFHLRIETYSPLFKNFTLDEDLQSLEVPANTDCLDLTDLVVALRNYQNSMKSEYMTFLSENLNFDFYALNGSTKYALSDEEYSCLNQSEGKSKDVQLVLLPVKEQSIYEEIAYGTATITYAMKTDPEHDDIAVGFIRFTLTLE